MKHRLLLAVTAATMLSASGMALADPSWRHAGSIGMRNFIVVEPAISGDAQMLKRAAKKVCNSRKACMVVFMTDAAAVPKKMPMSQAQKQAVVAQYFRNTATGGERLLLKCRADEPRESKCLH
ncbi:MAG TPA: hypothetical protein VK149_03170 [Sideroxyarcus sp.]|nr:hypothetical protein [Sideroxyarcus sp.]